MRRLFIASVFIFSAACGPATGAFPAIRGSTLTVFAAASLAEAFTEIGSAFEAAHPGVKVIFNFAGSQALRAQIQEGAQADVFVSASSGEVETLANGGFVRRGAAQVLLTNQLALIVPVDNPARIHALQDIAGPGIKLVLAAADVPVGIYARRAIHRMDVEFGAGFEERVLSNVVSNEDNARQVAAKVRLGEADAGIVYTSDAIATPGVQQIEIPPGMNVIAEYLIAPLSETANPGLAAEFIEYTLSEAGQAILRRWGFLSPP